MHKGWQEDRGLDHTHERLRCWLQRQHLCAIEPRAPPHRPLGVAGRGPWGAFLEEVAVRQKVPRKPQPVPRRRPGDEG